MSAAAAQPADRAAPDTSQWVQCDRCTKWRRVDDEYAKAVNDEDEWFCELNPDREFATCDVPQELPDEQIDQEAADLAGSPGGQEEGAPSSAPPSPPPEADQQQQGQLPKLPAVVQLITENAFSHRKRKVQDEDDIMVCHCPPPWRGGDGCGPNCINRMLCIECTEDFCPCENQCNNQMFSRRQYAKVAVRRAGPKGHGLYTDEDLAAGQFIIQYVGEVLEEEEYLRRKHYYIQTGQRHYYFMNIGNGEVIDACRKGNVARFINHSCEPNCETQKWMVRGELAIGLFTLRKIKAGEELTFDYNFERYGDKPMRCFCGSKRCRKFIGGTQETTANIVELGDADDVTNDPEPVLVREEETDALVQAMLDKEVGTTQRTWDSKLLGRLQQLCRSKGIDWSYAADEAGLTASTQQAAGNSSFAAEYQSEESSHAAGALPAATAASPASSSAPATGSFKSGLDGAESRPKAAAAAAAARKPRKRKQNQDPQVAAAAALKKQQQEERKRQRLQKQQERQQRQQQAFLRRQEQELQRLQRLRQQQLGQPPGDEQQQQAAEGEGAGGGQQRGAAGKQQRGSQESDLEDDMSSEDFQQQHGSEARDEDESDDESSSGSEEEEAEAQPPQQQQQQQQQRPQSGRVKVVQARRLKPPLAPKQQPKEQPAAPAKRSFLTLAVSAPSRPVKKRSEVDRRLEQLVLRQSWKLKEPSKQSVIKVLRMFNLCDITPRQPDNNLLLQQQQQSQPSLRGADACQHQQQQDQQQQQSDAGEQQMGGAAVVHDEAGLPALPAHLQPLQSLKGAELEARERESEARFKARQRARMADMGMILDVVLASTSEKLKREWVSCGILTQLQQALGRLPFTQEYSVVLVKVVGVLEHLPVTSDDLYTMRSAHGTFADLIRRMASSATDWEVRRRSHQLLKRYSAASCSDATLLQLYSLPGPNGKPYLLSLHLPPPQLARLTAMLPAKQADNNASNNSNSSRRRVSRRNTPPPRGAGGPQQQQQLPPSAGGAGPAGWPPLNNPAAAAHGGLPPPGYGYGGPGQQQQPEPHSSPSTSHGGGGLGGLHNAAAPAAAGQQQQQQEGGTSMAGDSSGGWPPQQRQQQQWEGGSGLPLPPWAGGGGGGGPPQLPPPGFRPAAGRGGGMGGWAPPGSAGLPPRPGSAGAAAAGGPSLSGYGPAGPSPGADWPDAAAGDRSPAGGGGGGRFPPPGAAGGRFGGPPPYDGPGGGGGGGGGPLSYRERERQRGGWGDRPADSSHPADWEPPGDYGSSRGREWEREWGPGGPRDEPSKRQRRDDAPGSGGPQQQWPPPYGSSPHDMPPQHHRMPPPGAPYAGSPHGMQQQQQRSPWVSDLADEPADRVGGSWRQQDLAAAAADGRGSRQSRWEERPQRAVDPAADPAHVPPRAAAEDLFVLGVYDSCASQPDWQTWSEAQGQGQHAGASSDAALSPIVTLGEGGRPYSPAGGAAAGGWGAPHQQHHHTAYPDSWDQPGPDFEAFVCEAVKHRLGKYVQPDHPNRISKEEAQQLYKKLRRQIVDKEAAACAERQAAGSHKPIERSKLEANIKEFVRLSIRRLHAGRPGASSSGAVSGGGANGMRHM